QGLLVWWHLVLAFGDDLVELVIRHPLHFGRSKILQFQTFSGWSVSAAVCPMAACTLGFECRSGIRGAISGDRVGSADCNDHCEDRSRSDSGHDFDLSVLERHLCDSFLSHLVVQI